MRERLKKAEHFADLQVYIQELYGAVNAERQWDYLYGYLVRSCGFMSINASKGNALPVHFVRAISWLFSIGNKVGINVVDQYLRRFPSKCYYCISSPCICHKTSKQPIRKIAAYKIIDERIEAYETLTTQIKSGLVVNYAWISNNISTIYPNNEIIWYHSGPWHHFTKLSEELAELHQALSKHEAGEDSSGNLGEELADVFAWILAIWQSAFQNQNLQEAFIDNFYNGCPVCKQSPCKCQSRKERRSGIVAVAELENLQSKVSDLAAILGSRQSELTDIQKSLAKAIETRNEQIAVQAVAQTRDRMETIKNTISDIDETGKKAVSAIDSVSGIASKLLSLVEIIRPYV